MAPVATNFRVRAEQWKFRLVMIETRQVGPRFYSVACLAPGHAPIGPPLRHLVVEFPAVRILVATFARLIFKAVRDNFFRISSGIGDVAFRASHGQMGARKGKAALLVHGNRVTRRLEAFHGVARFALIVIWSSRELSGVRVLVAIHAFRERQFVSGIWPRRPVTFVARNAGVLSGQRIVRSGVFLHAIN